MSKTPQYLDHLTTGIGPRPAASDTERNAAEWLRDNFADSGLPAEIQDFDTPRSTAAARLVAYPLFIAAVWALDTRFLQTYTVLRWACWAFLLILGILTLLDVLGKRGLSALVPKGPSQNVIARSVPSGRHPGQQPMRVVLVAHYDTALATPLTSESTAFLLSPLMMAAALVVVAMPLLSLLVTLSLRALADSRVWIGYALLVLCLPVAVVFINELISRLLRRYSPGANTNASGVAALLAIRDSVVGRDENGETGGGRHVARASRSSRRSESGQTSDLGKGGGLRADGGGGERVGDDAAFAAFAAQRPTERPATGSAYRPPVRTTAPSAPGEAQILNLETVEFGSLSADNSQDTVSFAALEDYNAGDSFAEHSATSREVLDADVIGVPAGEGAYPATDSVASLGGRSQRKKKGLFSGFGRHKSDEVEGEASQWLGLDRGFDARREGKSIGSWDNFGEDNGSDDGFSWKGGRAGGDPVEDGAFAANEAARIRRRVAENFDLNLSEKEIWFVATGAHFAGATGMRAFLSDYSESLRGALVINLTGLGCGDLYWTTKERFGLARPTSARLTSLARRVAREADVRIKALRTRAPLTEAGPALAAGCKAISVLRLTGQGIPFAWRSTQDLATRLDPEKIDEAAAFVTDILRQA